MLLHVVSCLNGKGRLKSVRDKYHSQAGGDLDKDR